MTGHTKTHSTTLHQRIIMRSVAVLMLCIIATIGAACGEAEVSPTSTPDTQIVASDAKEPTSTPDTIAAPTATTTPKIEEQAADTKESPDGDSHASSEEAKSNEDKHEDGEHASSSSEGSSDDESHSSHGSDDDDVVSNTNQISGSSAFDWAQNQALKDAEPLDIVSWTSGPSVSPGELSGEGRIEGDSLLFSPMNGEGAAFAVYHVNYDDEPMLVLLPSLGAMMIWDTDLTVAEMDYEMEGQSFSFRAYSPLLFDADPSDLKLRVFGFGDDGTPALLAISDIGFGNETVAVDADFDSDGDDASEDGEEDRSGEASSSSSDSSSDDASHSSHGSDDDDVVSNTNQITGSSGFDWAQNQALRDAEPLDIVSWTSGPAISPGALSGEGTIEGDALLFSPALGEGAAFAVYHVNYDDEPMLVLLPNLGVTMIWDTDLTVAEMDYEMEGQSFSFRAYSPLLFDADPSDLKLRVFGFDGDGSPALLAISDIKFE